MRKVATLQSKDRQWETGRSGKYPVDPKFFWIQHNCVAIHPTKMRTQHLFNALVLTCNNVNFNRQTVLIKRQGCKVAKNYRKRAIANLFTELTNRPDRTKIMEERLREIAAWMIERKSSKR